MACRDHTKFHRALQREFYRSLCAVKVLLAALRSTVTVLAPRREVRIGRAGEAVARSPMSDDASARQRKAAELFAQYSLSLVPAHPLQLDGAVLFFNQMIEKALVQDLFPPRTRGNRIHEFIEKPETTRFLNEAATRQKCYSKALQSSPRPFRRNAQLVFWEGEDGARYRVRTCDPYRVKVVLYH